jgi:hypothetical protein
MYGTRLVKDTLCFWPTYASNLLHPLFCGLKFHVPNTEMDPMAGCVNFLAWMDSNFKIFNTVIIDTGYTIVLKYYSKLLYEQ